MSKNTLHFVEQGNKEFRLLYFNTNVHVTTNFAAHSYRISMSSFPNLNREIALFL